MNSKPLQPLADVFQTDIQRQWQAGDRQGAVAALRARVVAYGPALPRNLTLQLVNYLFLLGDLKAALQLLQDLARRLPADAKILESLAVVQSRLGLRCDAMRSLEDSLSLNPNAPNAWDGLAQLQAEFGDFAAARRAGEEALRLKDAATRRPADWSLPPESPQAWLVRRPDHHVIAFSLWGARPRYLRGALRNLLLMPEIYPGWTARFYVDSTVPPEFLTVARSLGAEVVRQPEGMSLRRKLCWRFQVANDDSVGRFLIRDCDAVVNQRECRAVRAWLASDRYFHVMRDWWTHTDLVLAGMWGGVAGVLPDVVTLLGSYAPDAPESANADQWFLRDCLWGAIRQSLLTHDRCYRVDTSQPWPDPDPAGNFHVGMDEYTLRQQQQATWLQPWLRELPCLSAEG